MRLVDAIRIAREVTNEWDFTELRSRYINRVADYVDKEREQYMEMVRSLMIDDPLRLVPVSKVLEVVKKRVKKEIRFVPAMPSFGFRGCLYGYVDNCKDSATIVYSRNLNLCWQRFTIVKELMHIYTDTAVDRYVDVEGIKSAEHILVEAIRSRHDKWRENADLREETTALVMAMEVLVPWQLRSQVARLEQIPCHPFLIAKAFMVPLNFMELMLIDKGGKENPYRKLSATINARIDRGG